MSPELQSFRSYDVPAIFIQKNMATTDNDNDTEQNVSMNPVNLEDEGNISKSLLLVLNAMQENLTSSNSMLRELVERVNVSELNRIQFPKEQSVIKADHVVMSMLQRNHLRLLQKK